MRPIGRCNNKDTPVYHKLCFSWNESFSDNFLLLPFVIMSQHISLVSSQCCLLALMLYYYFFNHSMYHSKFLHEMFRIHDRRVFRLANSQNQVTYRNCPRSQLMSLFPCENNTNFVFGNNISFYGAANLRFGLNAFELFVFVVGATSD